MRILNLMHTYYLCDPDPIKQMRLIKRMRLLKHQHQHHILNNDDICRRSFE